MIVWRLTTKAGREQAFDGKGAAEYGGRWNREGTRVVYTAETLSLAVLEQLVHIAPGQMKRPFHYFRVEVPDDAIEDLPAAKLPAGWKGFPAPTALAELGTRWAASRRSLALAVPSAVVPSERNVILNPEHPAWRRLKVSQSKPFQLDGRLLKVVPPGRSKR